MLDRGLSLGFGVSCDTDPRFCHIFVNYVTTFCHNPVTRFNFLNQFNSDTLASLMLHLRSMEITNKKSNNELKDCVLYRHCGSTDDIIRAIQSAKAIRIDLKEQTNGN